MASFVPIELSGAGVTLIDLFAIGGVSIGPFRIGV